MFYMIDNASLKSKNIEKSAFTRGGAPGPVNIAYSGVYQWWYSLPAYAFIAQDFTTQAALYTHHQYIAGLSVWAWMFLFGHLVWATGFMFLISWRGYWQELIETLAWAHERTPLANLIRWRDKPVALSIVQARLIW
ncbi:putative photosystem I [Helianthus debilis subsp. tardiflorus]